MYTGTSLAVQWLRLQVSTGEGVGLICGPRTRIPHATLHNQQKEMYTLISLDFNWKVQGSLIFGH